ncbi:MAG TPA: maleylacetoacetate isomerase [Kofleriaceae bacterium]|nr:maleylacetoacetate isomerase [Kofleriaceae bacterium]
MKLRLHNYWRSSASHRVRIALGLLGLEYEYVVVDILTSTQKSDAYRAKNPMQQVPALELVDEGRFLTQSLPIIEYLSETHGGALLPKDPYLRARARGLAEIVNSGIQPLQNLSVTRRVKQLGGDDAQWARDFIRHGLEAFAALAADTAGRYCIGDEPTLADVCLVPQIHSARRFGASLDGLDTLVRISDECDALPAFANALPARQPDARAA